MNLIICIPTYNRNESLLNCLRSINNIIIYDKIKITALIVDNTKNNNSKNIINKNRQKFRFPIIHKNEKRRGIVFARNKCLHNLKKIRNIKLSRISKSVLEDLTKIAKSQSE